MEEEQWEAARARIDTLMKENTNLKTQVSEKDDLLKISAGMESRLIDQDKLIDGNATLKTRILEQEEVIKDLRALRDEKSLRQEHERVVEHKLESLKNLPGDVKAIRTDFYCMHKRASQNHLIRPSGEQCNFTEDRDQV